MTDDDWLACAKPTILLQFVRGRTSGRKRRLFAAACCRRVWHLLPDDRSRQAVEVAERFADGAATALELSAAEAAANDACAAANAGEVVGAAEAADAAYATACHGVGWDIAEYVAVRVVSAVLAGGGEATAAVEEAMQVALLRDVIGNPFRKPPPLDPDWVTPAVVALARRSYEDRDFGVLPVLAEALEEAGCTDALLLDHLRGPGPHPPGCFALDLVLGKR